MRTQNSAPNPGPVKDLSEKEGAVPYRGKVWDQGCQGEGPSPPPRPSRPVEQRSGQGTGSGTCGEGNGQQGRERPPPAPAHSTCQLACPSPHRGGHSHLQALAVLSAGPSWILTGPAAAPPPPGSLWNRPGQGCRVLRWDSPSDDQIALT